jgi:hypothetical protein
MDMYFVPIFLKAKLIMLQETEMINNENTAKFKKCCTLQTWNNEMWPNYKNDAYYRLKKMRMLPNWKKNDAR